MLPSLDQLHNVLVIMRPGYSLTVVKVCYLDCAKLIKFCQCGVREQEFIERIEDVLAELGRLISSLWLSLSATEDRRREDCKILLLIIDDRPGIKAGWKADFPGSNSLSSKANRTGSYTIRSMVNAPSFAFGTDPYPDWFPFPCLLGLRFHR